MIDTPTRIIRCGHGIGSHANERNARVRIRPTTRGRGGRGVECGTIFLVCMTQARSTLFPRVCKKRKKMANLDRYCTFPSRNSVWRSVRIGRLRDTSISQYDRGHSLLCNIGTLLSCGDMSLFPLWERFCLATSSLKERLIIPQPYAIIFLATNYHNEREKKLHENNKCSILTFPNV